MHWIICDILCSWFNSAKCIDMRGGIINYAWAAFVERKNAQIAPSEDAGCGSLACFALFARCSSFALLSYVSSDPTRPQPPPPLSATHWTPWPLRPLTNLPSHPCAHWGSVKRQQNPFAFLPFLRFYIARRRHLHKPNAETSVFVLQREKDVDTMDG